jgi:hypothetical protein
LSLQKVEKLKKGLSMAQNWNDEATTQATEILRPDMMSSEESEVEVDENGEETVYFKVTKLPWERKRLREMKKKLRKFYRESLSVRQKLMVVKRKRVDEESTRKVPGNAPEWAVRMGAETL